MEKEYKALEDQVRIRYASVAWTHKIQEKQAEIYDKRYAIIATINILCSIYYFRRHRVYVFHRWDRDEGDFCDSILHYSIFDSIA